MKREPIDLLSIELADSGIEEVDLSEGAMYKRAFKKFYYKQNSKAINEDEEGDCDDLDDEIDEIELNLKDEDTEIEEEDLP